MSSGLGCRLVSVIKEVKVVESVARDRSVIVYSVSCSSLEMSPKCNAAASRRSRDASKPAGLDMSSSLGVDSRLIS